ncbi:MAG: choice-of-anchor B domain-containing protein [Flavobacteriales bacterium]|jgi:choice-of-anchor B domain-containing protein
MKKLLLLVGIGLSANILLAQTPCEAGFAGIWPCENVDVWSFMTLDEIGGGANSNDVWGWTDSESGREFALIGKNTGTAFIEITDPLYPVYLGSLATQTDPSLWRDVKVYSNHAFVVSEAGDHGMQIFDLTQLLTVDSPPEVFENTAFYDGFGDAHNICINEESGFAYGVGADNMNGGLHIVDISDPTDPIIAGGYSEDGYTHDAQIVNYMGPDDDYAGAELAFACNENNIAIIDVSIKDDCQLISHMDYEEPGYVHQGWLTEDHKYFLSNDELDESFNSTPTRTFIFDVQDIDNPFFMGFYEAGNDAIDHNLYIIDDLVYESNYRSGLRILDAGDIENAILTEIAFFDVHPDNDNAAFSGSWSNYAWYPSGNVVVSDMYDGFFVLKPTIFKVNPAAAIIGCDADELSFEISSEIDFPGSFDITLEGLDGATIVGGSFDTPGATDVLVSGLLGLDNGIHAFQFIMTSTFGTYRASATITKLGGEPSAALLLSPDDVSDVEAMPVLFDWELDANTDTYHLEVATDIMFTDIVVDEVLAVNNYSWSSIIDNGLFYWRVSNTNECGEGPIGGPYSFQLLLPLSVEESKLQAFNLYPNPSSSNVTLSASAALGVVAICDLEGRIVESVNTTEITLNIDLSKLSAGTYIVRTDLGEQKLTIIE